MSAKFKKYTIKSGDTLQMIAQRMLGDAGRGMELAEINDLSYPFIAPLNSVPREGVRVPGDYIIIPIEVEHDTKVSDLKGDLDALAFGTDLVLTTDKNNLSFTHGGELVTSLQGDLQTVSGVKTLAQDLIHRLITEKGTLPYHPEYGSVFLSIVGNRNDDTWRQQAVIEVTRTFREDPRVLDVTNVFVEHFPTGIAVACNIVTDLSEFLLEELIK